VTAAWYTVLIYLLLCCYGPLPPHPQQKIAADDFLSIDRSADVALIYARRIRSAGLRPRCSGRLQVNIAAFPDTA